METIKKYFLYADLGSISVTEGFMYKNRSTYRSCVNAVISLILIAIFLFYSGILFYDIYQHPSFTLSSVQTVKDFNRESLQPDEMTIAYRVLNANLSVIPDHVFNKRYSFQLIQYNDGFTYALNETGHLTPKVDCKSYLGQVESELSERLLDYTCFQSTNISLARGYFQDFSSQLVLGDCDLYDQFTGQQCNSTADSKNDFYINILFIGGVFDPKQYYEEGTIRKDIISEHNINYLDQYSQQHYLEFKEHHYKTQYDFWNSARDEETIRTYSNDHGSYTPVNADRKNPNQGQTSIAMRISENTIEETWNIVSVITVIALLGGLFVSVYGGIASVLQYHNYILIRADLINDLYRSQVIKTDEDLDNFDSKDLHKRLQSAIKTQEGLKGFKTPVNILYKKCCSCCKKQKTKQVAHFRRKDQKQLIQDATMRFNLEIDILELFRLNRVTRFNNNQMLNDVQQRLVMYYSKEYVISAIGGLILPPSRPTNKHFEVSQEEVDVLLDQNACEVDKRILQAILHDRELLERTYDDQTQFRSDMETPRQLYDQKYFLMNDDFENASDDDISARSASCQNFKVDSEGTPFIMGKASKANQTPKNNTQTQSIDIEMVNVGLPEDGSNDESSQHSSNLNNS